MVDHNISNTQSDMYDIILLSCAFCWPKTCPIGDCHPSSLDNLSESPTTKLTWYVHGVDNGAGVFSQQQVMVSLCFVSSNRMAVL